MKLHGSAKLSPASRLLLVQRVESGWSVSAASASLGVSQRTGFKWLGRFRDGGEAALADRSSRPGSCPHQTPKQKAARILRLRKKRLAAWQIAAKTKLARSTVSRVLKRHGLGQLKNLDPKEPIRRYEKKRPGQLLHLDIKKLGRFNRPGHRVHGDRKKKSRGAGWECAHVAVDDCTRLAYAEVLPNEKKETVADFLTRAKRFYLAHGIRVERLLTDNGPGYCSKHFKKRCKSLGVKHSRTRPYRPQTNGKAERFIQTLSRQWAYGKTYRSSNSRAKALPRWISFYNLERPHHGIGGVSPCNKLDLFV
jgi:transposase InsO family protein